MSKEGQILCPAFRCKPGVKLLGVRQDDGSISILPQPLSIGNDFIESAANLPGKPEEHFRFTSKCIEGGCLQWNGKGCSVAEKTEHFLDLVPPDKPLPSCPIRDNCRWFLQTGKNACTVCVYVVTEISQEEMKMHTSPDDPAEI